MEGEDYFRVPKLGDEFWADSGKVFEARGTGLYSRRIILKPKKPKTRRVLVVEYRIVDGQNWTAGSKCIAKEVADAMAKDYPEHYRIEEREC